MGSPWAYSAPATGSGELGLKRETLEAFETPVPAPPDGRRDAVLRFEIVFSLGYVKSYPDVSLGSSERAYGMAGVGGSMGFADPDLQLGYGYAPNRRGFGTPTDPREVALRAALYEALGGPPQSRPGQRIRDVRRSSWPTSRWLDDSDKSTASGTASSWGMRPRRVYHVYELWKAAASQGAAG